MSQSYKNSIVSNPNDLVNVHFEENRKRQGLMPTTTAINSEEADSPGATDSQPQVPLDKSRKGSIDSRIIELVDCINGTDNMFTTSTCSGRAILFTHDESILDKDNPVTSSPSPNDIESNSNSTSSTKKGKKGCKWLYTTHDLINSSELLSTWEQLPFGLNVTFKVEPSILHIQCKTLNIAKQLIHLGTESGFRNSGMVIGKDNTVAIRSAIGMEVPLRKTEDPIMINQAYIQFLIATANDKLEESWKRTDSLLIKFKNYLNQVSKN